ncbi:MAG: hypothetical protein WB947_04245 [Thermoplasmata archaeon]
MAAEAFGLFERVFLGFVLLWMVLGAVHVLRADPAAPGTHPRAASANEG